MSVACPVVHGFFFRVVCRGDGYINYTLESCGTCYVSGHLNYSGDDIVHVFHFNNNATFDMYKLMEINCAIQVVENKFRKYYENRGLELLVKAAQIQKIK